MSMKEHYGSSFHNLLINIRKSIMEVLFNSNVSWVGWSFFEDFTSLYLHSHGIRLQ